ncbi:Uncharacterized conserved protein YgbK, DUF1537 family [Granulicella pectinivorans]|uniref:Uncharacterized conserved protein YgbK, DUF1537 family n=2 Tax=Granulicella pectinivorans TaxID=474950 RepID=A0A1I6MAZ9_9BACT|nr:Uncharacterized conserved protein YgbK, DUF1537 family [Granulicella pectinivorans]
MAIVADDLTGACDSGAAFAAAGLRVVVALDGLPVESADVVAFSTETRNFASDEAMRVVREAVSRAGRKVFKKVDSAGRGAFGAEIVAALETSRASVALVAPSFPGAGRVVRDGVLRVTDFAGQDTEIEVKGLFAPGHAIGVLRVDAVDEMARQIAAAVGEGMKLLLCDAVTQEDLERLVCAGRRVDAAVLWCGSMGLAKALAGLRRGVSAVPSGRVGRVLLFVGTEHPVTAMQVARLAEEELAPGRWVHHLTFEERSEHAVRACFFETDTGAMILTGGDTAAFVLRVLGASRLVLGGAVSDGIPWGVIEGGVADGCLVVTKSGGFGDRDSLADAFAFCERRQHETA